MRWLHFILSHSLFISVCAAAMCLQTSLLFHLQPNPYLAGLVFFSTLASYNFYWLLSLYSFRNRGVAFRAFIKKNSNYFLLSIVSSAGLLYCFFQVQQHWPPILIAVFFTVLYSVPLWPVSLPAVVRRAGFLKTTLLAFTWAFVTTVLPVYEISKINSGAVLVLLVARFFFFLMLTVIFDMRDKEVDKIHNLRTLATDLPAHVLKNLLYVIFLLYMIAGFWVRIHFSEPKQIMAFFFTGLAVFIVFRLSLHKRGYLFYYFLVDGLMLISFALSYLATL